MPEPTKIDLSPSVQIWRGDALRIIPMLADVAAFVTDPPYSSGGMVRGDRTQNTRDKYQSTGVVTEHACFSGDNRDQRAWTLWMSLWLEEALQVTIPGGGICLFSDWRQLPSATDALQAGGWVWRGIVPWDKVNARPMANRFRSQAEYILWGTNGADDCNPKPDSRYLPGVITCPPPVGNEREHSTQKPVDVMIDLVQIVRPGALVCDPFAGFGSTGIACIRAGRRFVGIEVNQTHFENMQRRLEKELDSPRLPMPEPEPQATQPELTAATKERLTAFAATCRNNAGLPTETEEETPA